MRRKDVYAEVGKSNMFVGNYLRFLWLNEIGEEERVVNECLSYFRSMTEVTGTLWEHDSPRASCNHGFASSIAAILLRSLIGYAGVKDGKPILKENFKHTGSISVKAEFDY